MTRWRLSQPSIRAVTEAADGIFSLKTSLLFPSPLVSDGIRSDALLPGNADLSAAESAGNNTSRINVLLPEPLTPVMQTNRPSGISTVRSLRLCRVAWVNFRAGQAFGLDAAFAGASLNTKVSNRGAS